MSNNSNNNSNNSNSSEHWSKHHAAKLEVCDVSLYLSDKPKDFVYQTLCQIANGNYHASSLREAIMEHCLFESEKINTEIEEGLRLQNGGDCI